MIFILVLFTAFILRLINLDQSFWLDEAAQIIESIRPLSQQFNLVSDFHPPLYHFILHFWIQLSTTEVWVRLLSVLFAIGSIIFTYKIALKISNKPVALITAALLSFSPFHIWYSQEGRPYMLFTFLSISSTYFLLKRKWVYYCIFLTLALYTNYFAFFCLISHIAYIYFFEKKYAACFIKCVAVALLLFSFWTPSFLKQLSIGTNGFFSGWTSIVSVSAIKTIPLTISKFIFGRGTFTNKLLYFLVIFPASVVFLITLVRCLKLSSAKKIIVFFLTPLLLTFGVAFVIPVVAPQRLLFLLPYFYMIIALGIRSMGKIIQMFILSTIFITSIGGIYQYWLDPSVQREQWRQAIDYIGNTQPTSSAVFFVFPDPFAPFLWYNRYSIKGYGIAPHFLIQDEDLTKLRDIAASNKRIYLFQYLTEITDPWRRTEGYLTANGFGNTSTLNYPGVGFIYIYDKK